MRNQEVESVARVKSTFVTPVYVTARKEKPETPESRSRPKYWLTVKYSHLKRDKCFEDTRKSGKVVFCAFLNQATISETIFK